MRRTLQFSVREHAYWRDTDTQRRKTNKRREKGQ
ncbi:Protein CBG26325 [Caenorhabditis briggsae]|uniref:Protein CBG26325 n=1 Tax=Caenorhabditis briggsae TaxID=6238 RepID=B6IG97_CAEBR|nr:Protein CBG26325 [Caenorhabditis briggsae]CAR98927.1 Protein CBG26325 [Caenorhabditis briggsae]